jgi:hypothetical protein
MHTISLAPWVASSTGTSVRVTSIAALKTALADNNIGTITVANGTYAISTASSQQANSLWIGDQFASRTRPVLVRAETRGGVTFDGGGASYFGCISFEGSAHHQTWDGFNCANGTATDTGAIVFGGYKDRPGAPHHITLRAFTVLGSVRGRSPLPRDHAVYFSYAPSGGVHDILIEDMYVDGAGGLSSAIHFYHSEPGIPNASNVTIRRLRVRGTDQAIILWDPTLRNIRIESSTITNARQIAIRYETTGSTGISLINNVSTGSGQSGFYSGQGAAPAGITFSGNSFG